MRIIAGDFKGRKLETPKNDDVRPTTDNVKEAIFNLAMEYIPGAICVDLFAGTGNLGLEAISRGAEKCYFCDNSRESLALVIQNVNTCKVKEQSVILSGDFSRGLAMIKEKVDVFFLDPPYKEGLYEAAVAEIAELDLLAEDGIIITEHSMYDKFPEEISGFRKIKEKRYGKIAVTIYG